MQATLRISTLLLALASALPLAAQAQVQTPAQAQPALVQAAPDVAGQWSDFLAHGTIEKANAAALVIDTLGYTVDSVDADKCRQHASELATALRDVPVSMLIQRAAMLCDEATGDRAGAERASAMLAALAKDAFAQATKGAWPKPVRIVYPGDAIALFASAGMTVRYEAYSQRHPTPYFPWMVAATPRDGGQEQLFSFDFIDTLQTLDRKSPAYGTPYLRMGYVKSIMDAEAKQGLLRSVDAMALSAAAEAETPQAKSAALRPAAEQGGITSTQAWMFVCALHAYAGCSDGLIDILLPQAEAKHGYAMLLLAMAYAEGIGVKADQKAAEALLDAADRQMAQHKAVVEYTDLYTAVHPDKDLPPFLRQRLQAARDAGNAAAAIILITADMRAKGKSFVLSSADEAQLADPANNGTGRGFLVLSQWYEDRDKAKSEDFLKRAASAGDPTALRHLAMQLRRAQGSAPPTAEALQWFEKAANGGDTFAMYYRGLIDVQEGKPSNAEHWLIPAIVQGDEDALFFLADLWAAGHAGMSGTPERAVSMLESLTTSDEYGARARRELASLAMLGRGMPKNPERARALLTQDAQAGDVKSQIDLGVALLYGRIGHGEQASGRKWMERAMAAHSDDAMAAFGSWLYYQGTGPGDRARGLALSRKAADRDDTTAINNVAWYLCVSSDQRVRDPAAGLVYSRKLEAHPEIGPSALDTVAACEASVGHYARAVELQQRVVDSAKGLSAAGPDNLKEMQARLALYQAGKPYIEDPAIYSGQDQIP